MEELKNEQTTLQSHTAGAEEAKGEMEEQVSLGKFKDVKALLGAYNSLESEFTKRCQKIKELEGKLSAVDKTQVPTETEEKPSNEEMTEKILKDYLAEVVEKKQSAIVMDGIGVGVRTPIERPKTISEAGKIFRQLLEVKN